MEEDRIEHNPSLEWMDAPLIYDPLPLAGSVNIRAFYDYRPSCRVQMEGQEKMAKASVEGNGIEIREYLNFKVGDLVKIRDYDEMAKQYGRDRYGNIDIPLEPNFTHEMKHLCGLQFIINSVDGYRVYLEPKSKTIFNCRWNYGKGMIEIVEENYVQNKKSKLKKHIEDIKTKIESKEDVLNEMISKVDKQKMKRILAGSFNIPLTKIVGVDRLLKEWAESKYDLYIMLGRELKVEKEIEAKKDEKRIRHELLELCYKYPAFYYIISNININDIRADRYSGDCDSLHIYSSELARGMKLTRFFSIVMNNKDFDIEVSKIFQNKTVKDTIAISIDPIDYMTMSMNKSGWSSCHCLFNTSSGYNTGTSWGQWSSGCFSYMCDSCSMISYRHSDKEYEFFINKRKFTQYSKSWREMIYFDINTKAFIASRQYPFESNEISGEVRKLLEEIVSSKFGFENKWKTTSSGAKKYIEDLSDLHYNDIINDMGTYKLCYPSNVEKSELGFAVGSEPICSICGERHLEEHGIPMCISCYHSR